MSDSQALGRVAAAKNSSRQGAPCRQPPKQGTMGAAVMSGAHLLTLCDGLSGGEAHRRGGLLHSGIHSCQLRVVGHVCVQSVMRHVQQHSIAFTRCTNPPLPALCPLAKAGLVWAPLAICAWPHTLTEVLSRPAERLRSPHHHSMPAAVRDGCMGCLDGTVVDIHLTSAVRAERVRPELTCSGSG